MKLTKDERLLIADCLMSRVESIRTSALDAARAVGIWENETTTELNKRAEEIENLAERIRTSPE